jgi:hypothetical protein
MHVPAASAAVDSGAIPPLVHLLSSSNNDVLLNVCRALATIKWELDIA